MLRRPLRSLGRRFRAALAAWPSSPRSSRPSRSPRPRARIPATTSATRKCGRPFPRGAAFGVIGVNGGRAFTRNPCLAAQLRWARRTSAGRPAFYANTGNPGPA
jgi:hypothetical protein